MRRLLLVVLPALLLLPLAVAHAQRTGRRPSKAQTEAAPLGRVFLPVIKKVKGQTRVPILLPSELPPSIKVADIHFIDGEGKANGYDISLFYKKGCGDACAVGFFLAKRGEKAAREDFDKVVRLANGVRGFYRAKSCGGSCTPPEIDWEYKGVLYAVQFNVNGRNKRQDEAEMIALANSAILGGER